MNIPKSWTFKDKAIADNFDAHVREQLPFYDLVTDSIVHIVKHYLPNDGLFYDIGAATGNLGVNLEDAITNRNVESIAIDNSKEMCAVSKYKAIGNILCQDAVNVKYRKFDVAVIFLVLIFLQPSKQLLFLKKLQRKVKKGGCIILCERFLPETSYMGIINQRLSLVNKLNNGVKPKYIIQKELSLSGIQRPLSYLDVKSLGFVDFFQLGDFRGLIFEK